MPPAVAILATSALATWGVAASAGMLTIFGTTLGLMQSFLVRAAIGLTLQALAPKPKTGQGSIGGYAVTSVGSALDHQIIYGRTKIGGAVLYDSVTNEGSVLNRVIAYAGHRIESFDEVYFNDDLLTIDVDGNVTAPAQYVGKAKVFKYLGTDDQAASAPLMAQDPAWTSDHKLSGIAYLYIQLTYSRDAFPNGIPDVPAVVRGRHVYDPRTGLTGYSNNAALAVRDYITSPFGLNSPFSEIDDTLFMYAANICEEAVNGELRYTTNGAFTTDATPVDVLTSLVGAMAGTMWYAQGQWRVLAGSYIAPTLSLTADDLRSPLVVSTRHSRRDNYNKVKGTFRGPSSNWNTTDFPAVTEEAFLETDNGLEQSIDITLPFTSSPETAQRIARLLLRKNRQQLTVQASFGLRAFKAQVGETVYLTYERFGWIDKEFEVQSWTFSPQETGELLVDLVLRETSEDVYTDVPGAVFENDNTSLGSPQYVPSVGLEVNSEVRSTAESVTNVLVMDVITSNASLVDKVEVQVQKAGATNWILVGTGSPGTFEYPVAGSSVYNIRAAATSVLGVRGPWTTIENFLVANTVELPEVVGTISHSISGGYLNLSWPASDNNKLSHYVVRHTSRTTTPTWADSTIEVEKVARPATSVTVPVRPGTYMVKAIDKLGNESPTESIVVIPSVPSGNTVLLQAEAPSFSGAKTNTSVTASNLKITSFATAPSVGSYTFSNYVDTGAVRECQVRVDLTTSNFSTLSSNWDDIVGFWDGWVGNWDSWGTAPNAVTDVVVYVSTTDDNPAGSPTWTPYTVFKSGVIKARAFRFKVDLKSFNNNYTPSVSDLTARIEY